eukprot:3706104-Rhodomonas_salina.1
MPGTDLAPQVHSWHRPQALRPPHAPIRAGPLSAISLRAFYAISGTGLRYQPTRSPALDSDTSLRASYAMSGTDIGDGGSDQQALPRLPEVLLQGVPPAQSPTRCPVLTSASCYALSNTNIGQLLQASLICYTLCSTDIGHLLRGVRY